MIIYMLILTISMGTGCLTEFGQKSGLSEANTHYKHGYSVLN